MDILMSLSLIFVNDALFSQGFYVDPHPLLYYVNSVLPLHMVQLIPTIALLYYLTLNEKLQPKLYQAIFVFLAYGAWLSVYSWILRSYPENYYLNFFLEIFFILTGACAVLLHMIYISMEEDVPRIVLYVRFRYVLSVLFGDTYIETEPFISSAEFKRAVRALGAYWLIVAVGQPLSWFDLSQWNLWNGVFVEGMNTPLRVCAMGGLLLFFANYALDTLKIFIFGEINSDSMEKSTDATLYFLGLLLDFRVWALDPEQRSEMVLICFLSHLLAVLEHSYNVYKYPLLISDPGGVSNQGKKARVLCFLTFIVTMCAFYLAWSTPALTVHSIILLALIVYLIVKMSIQISTNLVYRFRWFSFGDNAKRYQRILDLMIYTNHFCKQLIRTLCVVWMLVFHAVKWYRVVVVLLFFRGKLLFAKEFYLKNTKPWICIRSLPRASEEQLALKNDVCLMCHENMEEARVTPCNHYYHHNCLLKWLFVDYKCPLCQTVLCSS